MVTAAQLCQYTENHLTLPSPCFSVYQGFILFYGQVIFRCVLDHRLAVHQLMALSPLWGHHDHTCTSLCVEAFFSVLDTHLGVVLFWWHGEHGDPASRFPVFLLPSLETCCTLCPRLWSCPLASLGLEGPTIRSSSCVLLQPCLGMGTEAGCTAVRAPGAESCLHGHFSLPCLCLSVSYLPLSREPAAPICPLAITHSWPGRHQEVVQEGSLAEA